MAAGYQGSECLICPLLYFYYWGGRKASRRQPLLLHLFPCFMDLLQRPTSLVVLFIQVMDGLVTGFISFNSCRHSPLHPAGHANVTFKGALDVLFHLLFFSFCPPPPPKKREKRQRCRWQKKRLCRATEADWRAGNDVQLHWLLSTFDWAPHCVTRQEIRKKTRR